MKAVGVLGAIALTIAVQTTLARFMVGGIAAPDLVLVLVVYLGLTSGPVTGMLAGSLAGIMQDALSSGVIGIGGLAKSMVGFVVGVVGLQFIVTAALPRVVVFVAATAVHATVLIGLYEVLGLRSFPSPWAPGLSQAIGNAVVGMMAFTIVESVPGAIERRRQSRRAKD